MHLLYYAPDNASLIVRITLEELGAPYETRLVDRRTRAQDSAEYRALNPSGLIPTCVIDGEPVFETAAIILSLAERHGALAPPTGDKRRPGFLKWLFFLSNTLHAELRLAFYPEQYAGAAPAAQAAFREHVGTRLARRFAAFEDAYGRVEGPYLFGDGPESAPGLIDIYLAACLRWAQLYPADRPVGFDPAAAPAIGRMLRALERRPAVARACAAEGIALPCFTAPRYATPPEGSAT